MRFIERFLQNQYELDRFDEESRYTPARTVGAARVKDVLSFGDNPQFEIVLLALEVQEEGDKSRQISRVPVGLFKKGDIAEVIVKRKFH